MGTVSKAIGGSLGSIVTVIVGIVAILPDTVQAQMTFAEWAMAIVGAAVIGFAAAWIMPKNTEA